MNDKLKLIPFEVTSVSERNVETTPEGIRMIQAPDIWDKGDKGNNVVVAIIDTGCDTNHPDLRDAIIGGKNFTDVGSHDKGKECDYTDNLGHGTHVAGTIAAVMNNYGVVGVAPNAKLLILKGLRKGIVNGIVTGIGDTQWIIDAIKYAIEWRGTNGEKVKVINMSLGGPNDDPELHKVIKDAVDNEISVVCAAGNEGDNNHKTTEYDYPGSYNEVITVGAIDFNEKTAIFSNSHEGIDLVAPGVNINSTFIKNESSNDYEKAYARLEGTSMAAPHVSGAIALLTNMCREEFSRELTEAEIYAQLIRRTVPLGHDKKLEGNGLLSLSIVDKLPNCPK